MFLAACSWDVLTFRRVRIPLGDVRRAQEEALAQNEDFLLQRRVKNGVEAANSGELTTRERSGIIEMLAILE